MAAFMGRFKVGTRVYAGFITVLILLVVIAVVGIRGLSRSAESFGTYEAVSASAVNVTLIDRQIVGLRRNVLVFTGSTGDDKAMERIRQLQRDLEPALDAAIAGTDHPQSKADLERIRQLYKDYAGNLDKLIGLRQKRDKLVNEGMNVVGQKARAQLSEIIAATMAEQDFKAAALAGLAQEALMLARLNAVRYLSAPDARLLETTNRQIETFDTTATALVAETADPGRKAIAEQIDKAASAYKTVFNEAAAVIAETNTLVTRTMAGTASEIAARSDQVRTNQMKSMAAEKAGAEHSIDSSRGTAVTIAVIAGLGGLLLAWAIASGIVNPVRAMTEAMTRLAGGDKAVPVPALDNKDEIGDMARAVEVFKRNALEMDRLQAEQEVQKRRAEEEKHRAMNALADGFDTEVKGVVNTVSSAATEMEATAQAMSSAAQQASRQATVVSAASEEASASVQTVASAAEELSSSISEIARQVAHSARIAEQGAEAATRTNAVVLGLAEAADRIGEVVKLISDIASQTNLLALNATIEAARAGDAGKGFAVVANEVKTLANQTAKPTDDISRQVSGIQAATGDAVGAIREIGAIITQINEISSTVAAAVEEQGAATQEIARNTQQAAIGTEEVSKNITGVTEAAGETGQAAGQVLSAAGQLAQEAEVLRGKVESFIAKVRVA